MERRTAWLGLALLLAACGDRAPRSEPPVVEPEEEVERPRPPEFVQNVRWSADGRRLLVTWFRGGRYRLVGLFGPSRDGAPPGEARGIPLVQGEAWGGSFAPSGLWVAFTSRRDGNGEIYRVRPDGTGPENLTMDPAEDMHPAFSPNGRLIAFVSDRAGGEAKLHVMAADGGEPRVVGVDLPPGQHAHPAWSPDGQWLLFVTSGADGDQIYRVGRDGDGLRHVGAGTDPAWSADGDRILFSRDGIVWTQAENGEAPAEEVTEGFAARESPDGRWLAFARGEWPYASLYLRDLNVGSESRITP